MEYCYSVTKKEVDGEDEIYVTVPEVKQESQVGPGAFSVPLLIDNVKSFTFLYDRSNPNFKLKPLKDAAWRKIGELMEFPWETCHVKWLRLRERYCREKQASEDNNTVSQWRFYKDMDFLSPFVFRRKYLSGEPAKKCSKKRSAEDGGDSLTAVSSSQIAEGFQHEQTKKRRIEAELPQGLVDSIPNLHKLLSMVEKITSSQVEDPEAKSVSQLVENRIKHLSYNHQKRRAYIKAVLNLTYEDL